MPAWRLVEPGENGGRRLNAADIENGQPKKNAALESAASAYARQP
jgi:hypothetical protein